MKLWIERTLAGLRWAGERLVAFGKVAYAKLHAWFDMTFDPPPRTRRFYFLCALAIFAVGWISYAFVNSWFYKPTIQALAEFSYVLSGDDGDVALPEMEPVSPVAVTALPAVEAVCHDMSDTPHCEPVYESPEKHSMGTQTEAQANPAEKAIAYKPQKKAKAYKKRRRPAAVLTPARDDFRLVL